MQSLKIVTILRKEANLSVPQVCSEYFSATDYRPDFLGDLEKVDENKAEFENNDNLKKRSC